VPDLPTVDGRTVEAPDRAQFEFWVGTWTVRSEAGPDLEGTNNVGWVLGGAVLQEDFGAGDDSFRGHSVSVPVAGRGWVQTWVDSSGAYLDFVGGWLGDRMVLERTSLDGTRQRMCWYDIAPDALLWDWSARAAGTDGWRLNWRLRYARRPGPAGPNS
jgi:hypothetical protein